MGANQNKVYLPLVGRPVGAWAIAAFEQAPEVDETLVVAHPAEVERASDELVARPGFTKVGAVIAGGASRHESEDCALAWLRPRIEAGAIDLVMIHDGARPLITPPEIAALIADVRALGCPGGALLATPVAPDEIIAQVDARGRVALVFAVGGLARAQTPQVFAAPLLLAAYDHARATGFEATDTASVVEALGAPVAITPGAESNLKVTTPDDLLRAEAILAGRDGVP